MNLRISRASAHSALSAVKRKNNQETNVAGGLSGALREIEAIPPEWIETVEKGVLDDPYTVSRRTARQSAEGLNQACINEMQRIKWSDLPEIGTQCLAMFQEGPLQCGINTLRRILRRIGD